MDTSFWLKYQTVLKRHNIPSKRAEWYMRWIKSFDKALPNVPLFERTKEDVQAYMDVLVRRNKYQDWQLEQANEGMSRGRPLKGKSRQKTFSSNLMFS